MTKKQAATFIKWFLESSPWLRVFQKKNRPEKFQFVATNDRILSAVRWSVKYFFTNSLIFWKSSTEKGETGNFKALCFKSKRK